ncbi:MAG: AN1-type zinc finger domain-containing protein [Promethearchaeota archaeon]
MPDCYFCKKNIDDIPYRCTFCGMLFCNAHRLPENHNCPFDLKKSSEFEDLINKWDILYQDALDFMNKDLTVAKIYEYFTTKQLNDEEAIELLTYILENSDDTEIRRISILAFKVLELKKDKAFTTLENCILTEEDITVKKTAIEVIQYIFPKKSKDLIRWVNTHNKNFLD